jgi:myo-inositol-1(or 4)-monophosphatase
VSLAEFESAAVELADAAGRVALEAFRGTVALEFKGKKQDSPVTALDRDIETFLRTELKKRFPTHGLLGEEHADDIAAEAEYVWVIDPVDGTANFASGLPLWGISIGLLQHGVPVVGCIFVPVGPFLEPGSYHAHRASGCRFNSLPASVSRAEDERGQIMGLPGDYLRTFRVRRSKPGTPRHNRYLPDARTLGSCTAELMLVASGALRAATFVKPSIWDVAAGAVLVREAGGEVVTWQDRKWQRFERFEPRPPDKGEAPPALRHWGQPLVVGAPEALQRLLPRLAWHPRLPRRLQRLIEGEALNKLRQAGLPL